MYFLLVVLNCWFFYFSYNAIEYGAFYHCFRIIKTELKVKQLVYITAVSNALLEKHFTGE